MKPVDKTVNTSSEFAAGSRAVARAGHRGLIVAVLGAALLGAISPTASATALGDLAATMQPGEWKQLSTTGFNGGGILQANVGADKSYLEFTDKAVRNPLSKKVYIIGCARGDVVTSGYDCGNTGRPGAGFVEYDEATNSWRRMPTTAINTAFHAYNHATIDPATGDFYYWTSGDRVRRLRDGNLTTLPGIDSSIPPEYTALEYFPERNALTLINARDRPSKLHSHVLGSNGWTSQSVSVPNGIHTFSRYSAKHKLLYFGGGENNSRGLFIMNAQGNVTRAADAPVSIGIGGNCPVHVVDPVSGNLIVMSPNRSIYEYDPVANSWSQAGSHSLKGSGEQRAVAVSIPEHGVIFVAKWDFGSSAVLLYKHSPGSPLPPDTTPPLAPTGLNVQ